MDEVAPARVVFSQSVKINIGDYETRDVFLSYADNVGEDESPASALKRVKKFVQKRIHESEKTIRFKSRKFTDFDTMAKVKDVL